MQLSDRLLYYGRVSFDTLVADDFSADRAAPARTSRASFDYKPQRVTTSSIMHSQIQCPVCTLYLHVGMNLSVHLDTHPKEQVIRALVNMTVVQSSPEDEPVNQMQCSRYAPLNDETLPLLVDAPDQSVTSAPSARPESTAVAAATPVDTLDAQLTTTLSISNFATQNQTILTQSTQQPTDMLPPPPPYGEYSKLCAIVRSDSNTKGISTHARNHILQEATKTPAIETMQLDVVAEQDDYMYDENEEAAPEFITDSHFNNYDDIYTPDEHFPSQAYEDDFTDTPDTMEFSQEEAPVHDESAHFNTVATARPIYPSARVRRIADRRKSNGLHVLSDVTLTPDISIKSIINAQRVAHRNDRTIHLYDMFHGRAAAKSDVVEIPAPSQSIDEHIIDVDADSIDNEVDGVDDEPIVENVCQEPSASANEELIEIASKEDDQIEPDLAVAVPSEATPRNIIIVKIESLSPTPPPCAATSVIRMASSPHKHPNTPTTQEEPEAQPIPSASVPTTPPRTKALVKAPFAKSPKKLIVKFKTPFVPVIEEEANMQPPDRALEPIPQSEDVRISTPELPEETIDSHPFSPFRQSYTPLPPMTFNQDDDDDPWTHCIRPTTPDDDTKPATFEIKNEDAEAPEQPVVPIDRAAFADEDSKDFVLTQSDIDESPEDDKLNFDFKTDCMPDVLSASSTSTSNTEPYVSVATTSASASSSFSSASSSTSCTPHSGSSADADYSICLLLGANKPNASEPTDKPAKPLANSTDEFPTPHTINEYDWAQRFSPQYIPFETDKLSYTNLDDGKTVSRTSTISDSNSFERSGAAAAATTTSSSSDSLNIRTDEQMPAKGEISEQESNGDLDGSWSLHETCPPYTSSYDTTVARESWSLGNGPSGSHVSANSHPRATITSDSMHMMLPKFTAHDATLNEDEIDHKHDIKPNILDVFLSQPECQQTAASTHSHTVPSKVRRFRCTLCPLVFLSLKIKRSHLMEDHKITPYRRRNKPSATVTSSSVGGASATEAVPTTPNVIVPPSTPSSATNPLPSVAKKSPRTESLKKSAKKTRKPEVRESKQAASLTPSSPKATRLSQYLLNYNWSVLRDRLILKACDDVDHSSSDVKLPDLPTESNAYMCMVCYTSFKSVRTFDEHMIIHPAECYTCGREFRHWYNLSIHLKRHLNIKDHACKQCPKRFASRPNLIDHMAMHSTVARLQCKICMRRFRRQSNLILHRKRDHLNIRPRKKDFICWCGEVFHSKAKIAWHRETHDKTPKCCPHCRERFVHRNSLSRHIRISHTDKFVSGSGTEIVECTVCAQKFLKTSLKLHLLTHDLHPSELEFGCTICNKSFTTKWNLKQHKWVHASRSTKPFRCAVCPKAFVRESDYNTHINTHKSIKPYTCDHCGLQFARKYNWLRHTREHEKPKAHKCDDCGKIFHRAYYLKEHRRTHTGERPYECVICGKTSTTKTNHNKHIKIHHARDPLPAET